MGEVHLLRDGAPSLRDIPSLLRGLADRVEAGEEGTVETVFVVAPVAGDYPRVWGWGDVDGQNDPVIQLELARMWLLTNLVRRR